MRDSLADQIELILKFAIEMDVPMIALIFNGFDTEVNNGLYTCHPLDFQKCHPGFLRRSRMLTVHDQRLSGWSLF